MVLFYNIHKGKFRPIYSVLIVLLFSSSQMWAQNISAPALTVPYACATASFNSYTAATSYSAPGFNSDNSFILEMSDAAGNFQSPYELATLNNQNFRSAWAFDFKNFAFPVGLGGNSFKLRIRSTSPVKISPSSSAFSYYYYDGAPVVLNNYQREVLCGEQSIDIKVSPDTYSSYKWYKNARLIEGETGSSLKVNSPGNYFAEVDLGPCNLNIVESISNAITVTRQDSRVVSIVGPDRIDICPSGVQTLEAQGVEPNDKIQWFKNGEAVTAAGNFPKYTTLAGTTEGVYYFRVTNNASNCAFVSQEVTVSYQNVFTVTNTSPLSEYLLIGQSASLTVSTTAGEPKFQWYKNDVLVAGAQAISYSTSEPGVYKVIVSDANGCAESVASNVFTVAIPDNYKLAIAPSSGYVACQSVPTILRLDKITAVAPDGSLLDLSPETFPLFSVKWIKNSTDVLGVSDLSFPTTASDNGSYIMEAQYAGKTYTSNLFELAISNIDPAVVSDGLSICSNTTFITLKAIQNDLFEYLWYKNNQPIIGATNAEYKAIEPGNYYCEISDAFCIVKSEVLAVTKVDESAITILPSNMVTISANSTRTITATGGDSYLWTDSDGQEVSTSSTFTTSTPGVYTVLIKVGSCEYDRSVTVIDGILGIIPNVITANGDGINEKWLLPPTYQSNEITVTIYNAAGNVVFTGNNYQNNWPENSVSPQLSSPVYYYTLTTENRTLKKGTITVLK